MAAPNTLDKNPSDAARPKLPPTAQDWLQTLASVGLTPAMIGELNKIWIGAGGDAKVATPLALRYVRSTPWYAKTYPGISAGINAGLFSDERGYSDYRNTITQVYKQYYNRAPTNAEVGVYVTKGQSPTQIAKQFSSAAAAGSIPDPLKKLFTPAELKALTDQAAGIDTALGQRIKAEAELASGVSQMYQDFTGKPVSRAALDSLLKAGATPEAVGRAFAQQENVNAMNPAVAALFTPGEVQQAAAAAAGSLTPEGKKLQSLMSLTAQLNPIYHQYTGQGVSRAEVDQAFQAGTDPAAVAAHFGGQAFVGAHGQEIQQALGSFGDGQASAAQLQTLGENAVGYDSAMGQQLQASFEKAQRRMQTSFRSTLGRATFAFRSAGQGKPTDVGA